MTTLAKHLPRWITGASIHLVEWTMAWAVFLAIPFSSRVRERWVGE